MASKFRKLIVNLLLPFTLLLSGCDFLDSMNANYSIEIPNKIDLEVETEKTLNGKVLYKNTETSLSLVFESEDEEIVKVTNNAKGKIRGFSIGKTNVVARLLVNRDVYAVCEVNVIEIPKVLSVELNKSTASLSKGETLQLTAVVNNATDTSVTWTGSKNGITVDENGLVSVALNATIGATTTIVATSVEDPTKFDSCQITVVNNVTYMYDYTIMYYFCGSNLEYDPEVESDEDNYFFTKDILEILSVDYPSNVKVLIETGGTKRWGLSKENISGQTFISSTTLQRWEVVNHKLTFVGSVGHNRMASEESFESFLKWGLKNYNAKEMGVVISGHGGGIAGCAYDDNYSFSFYGEQYQHTLNTKEIAEASYNALNAYNRNKFTFIAYDCCIMQCADIASINADYYNYMVASQESELATGFNHDIYLEELAKNPSIDPKELLTLVSSSFYDEVTDLFCSRRDYCMQTSSVLDLNKMSFLVNDFNTYFDSLGYSPYSNIKKAFKSSYNNFGDKCYGLCDFKSFVLAIDTQCNSDSSKVLESLNKVVIANYCCSGYRTKICGLNAFFPLSLDFAYDLQVWRDDYDGKLATKFSGYQKMCLEKSSEFFDD